MARQFLIPGEGYVNDVNASQYLIPGFGYFNGTGLTGAVFAYFQNIFAFFS